MVEHENILGLRDEFGVLDGTKGVSPAEALQNVTKTKKRQRESSEDKPPPRKRPRISQSASGEKKSPSPRTKTTPKKGSAKVLMGIDIGTTSSGAAIYFPGNEFSTPINVQYQNSQNDVKEKIPSSIAFGIENGGGVDRFGPYCLAGMVLVLWWKLLWDELSFIQDINDTVLANATGGSLGRLPEGMTVETVSTAFLKFIYDRAIREIQDRIGEATLDDTPLIINLSVPATWNAAVRRRYLRSAEAAGIGSRSMDQVCLIDEPEAATLAAMQPVLRGGQTRAFKEHTCVLVLDFGGGTMDAMVWNILQAEPLKIREACAKQAFKCGGTDVDRNLHVFMKQTFGHAFKDLPSSLTASLSHFMKAWEGPKCEYRGEEDDEEVYRLPLAMNGLDMNDPAIAEVYDSRDATVKITGYHIGQFYAPVISKMKELICELSDAVLEEEMPEIETVILCGGLGCSPHMREEVKKYVDTLLAGRACVISPLSPWAAVQHGAALAGLGKSPIVLRKAQRHIGLCTHEKYDDQKHSPADRIKCPYKGLRAKGQMCWYLKRGEDITPGMTKTIRMYAAIPVPRRGENSIEILEGLYFCSNPIAPSRMDATVKKFGDLRLDVTDLVRKKASNKAGKKTSHVELTIDIEVGFGSLKGVLEISAKCGREKIKYAEIDYDCD